MNPEEELLEAIRLNDSCRYVDAFAIFVKHEALLDTPLLISHFALSKLGAEGEGADFDRALAKCIKSLKSDITNPEIYYNLAKIYLLFNKKALALKAIEKGLRYGSVHAGLKHLLDELGERREVAIGFLPRGAAINKSIGKFTHKDGKPEKD